MAAAETNSEREGIIFPDNHIQDAEITCADLTQYFLIYGTDVRDKYFFLYAIYICLTLLFISRWDT